MCEITAHCMSEAITSDIIDYDEYIKSFIIQKKYLLELLCFCSRTFRHLPKFLHIYIRYNVDIPMDNCILCFVRHHLVRNKGISRFCAVIGKAFNGYYYSYHHYYYLWSNHQHYHYYLW